MESNNKFTAIHRTLHWIVALAMPILFITGFLRMYWMNKNHIVSVIESKTAAMPISKEVMTDIAKTIRSPMWEWHEIFAVVMIVAFVLRIIYMIAKGIRFPNPFKSNSSFKERFQGFIYVYFYVFVFISAVTGFSIQYNLFETYGDTIEIVHKWGIYWFPIFVILHIVGVVIAEMTSKKGITSKMIGGD